MYLYVSVAGSYQADIRADLTIGDRCRLADCVDLYLQLVFKRSTRLIELCRFFMRECDSSDICRGFLNEQVCESAEHDSVDLPSQFGRLKTPVVGGLCPIFDSFSDD